MSWINENKFAATLAGITAVGSIGLFYLSMQKDTLADEAEQQLKGLLSSEKSLMASSPYPNAANQEEMENSAESFAREALRLQQEFLAYRPESMEDFESPEFTSKLIAYSKSLQALYKENQIGYPDGGFFGFGDYASVAPKQLATAELDYQLRASQWLFTQLAEVKPEKLINVVRPQMPVELEAAPPKIEKPKRQNRRNNKANRTSKRSTPKAAVAVYDTMPMEISFLCTEKQFTDFYEKLANSEEFCFAVRSLRIQNEVGRPPSADDAKFEEAIDESKSEISFDDFTTEEEVEAPAGEEVEPTESEFEEEESVDTAQILKQVLGSEKINVYMKLDLLLLKPESEVGLGKAAGLKTQPANETKK